MGIFCSRVCSLLARVKRSFCEWRAACRSSESAASILKVVAFDEFFDNFGADWRI